MTSSANLYSLLRALFLLTGLALAPALSLYAQTVPPLPTERADRFGIYNWGVDYAAYPPGTMDRLNWAADKVAHLGSRTIRVALPGDIYLVNEPDRTDLAQIATSAAYDRLFSDARFQTYLLTTYSASDLQGCWQDGFTTSEYYATREEFARLGETLLSNPHYAGKTFIILNWEGDNAMAAFANKQSSWDAFTAWIQARADGIKDARLRQPNSTAHIYSGLEFNAVRAKSGAACGAPVTERVAADPLKNRCVIDYVAPRVTVDYYSYSAWQTIISAAWKGQEFKTALQQDLQFALAQVRRQNPTVQARNFVLGEYGFHRSYWGESGVANFVNAMFDAVEAPDAFPVSYAIFWQIIDNAPSYANGEDGFGLYRSRHQQFALTRAGQTWQQRMAGHPVASFAQRPLIQIPDNQFNSIANAPTSVHSPLAPVPLNNAPPLTPTTTALVEKKLLIEAHDQAAGFSPTNNAVRLEQGVRQYLLPRDYPLLYSESESQIVTGLPAVLRPGLATVYVNDEAGVESNAQRIELLCAACPTITHAEDTRRYLGELNPGSIVTLHGRNFSPTNNALVIEQQDAAGQPQSFTVPRDDVWQENDGQITARLPVALLPNKLAIAIVRNQAGTESNEFALWISAACNTCAPVLRPVQGVVNRADKSDNLSAGTEILIRGERFSEGGNKVVIEQGTRRFVLPAASSGSDASTSLVQTLPADLQSGYAILYVVDAQGRESRAQALNIGRRQTHRGGR
ncbi:MAG: hypothetical protein U0Y68_23785 [Blastocatellia bacterium]